MTITLNEQTMTVTEREWGETMEYSYLEYYAANFVMQHLSSIGIYKDVLGKYQWQIAYLKCDGYGKISRMHAVDQSWDWSHVRDSKTTTLVEVADYIAKEKWDHKSIEAIVNYMLDQTYRLRSQGWKIDLLEIVPSAAKEKV